MENLKQKYYTATEVANILSVTPQTVVNWLNAGELAGYRFGGKGRGSRWRIPENDLNNFLASNRHGG